MNYRCSAAWFASLLMTFAFIGDAAAVTKEQAKAQCHNEFVPIVKDCVRKKVAEKGGSPQQYIPGCRDAVMPQARACVAKLMGQSEPAAPTPDTSTTPDTNAAPTAPDTAATPAAAGAATGPAPAAPAPSSPTNKP